MLLLNNKSRKNTSAYLPIKKAMPMVKFQPSKIRLSKQQGSATLVTVLLLLITMTLLTLSNTRSSIINTKMNGNILDKNRAILAADSASRYAWNDIKTNYNIEKFVQNTKFAGHYDLREDANKKIKNKEKWNSFNKSSTWNWSNKKTHYDMPDKLSLGKIDFPVDDKTNPMNLSATPQYVKGLHDPVLRTGTESFHCVPITILGAAKGGLETTQSLVEIKVVPKKGCFRSLVK